MYTFARIKDVKTDFEHDWMYYIDNLIDLEYYHETVLKGMLTITLRDLIESSSRNYLGHCNTTIGGEFHSYCELTGQGEIKGFLDLSGQIISDQTKAILKYGAIVINHNHGYFPINYNFVVIEKKEAEEFPFEYTEKDIKITKWPEGSHYYAKIKNLDVKYYNEIKWNTYEIAYERSLWFLKQLNKIRT